MGKKARQEPYLLSRERKKITPQPTKQLNPQHKTCLTAAAVPAAAAGLVPGVVVVRLNVACREVNLELLEHVSSVSINLNGVLLDERDVRDIVELLLTLLLLELERDAAHGAALDAAHEVGEVSGNLVAHALGWHNGALVDNTLVDVEVKGEAVVILLNNLARSALDGFGANASHLCEKR